MRQLRYLRNRCSHLTVLAALWLSLLAIWILWKLTQSQELIDHYDASPKSQAHLHLRQYCDYAEHFPESLFVHSQEQICQPHHTHCQGNAYTLQSVVMVTRHGERAPLHFLPNPHGARSCRNGHARNEQLLIDFQANLHNIFHIPDTSVSFQNFLADLDFTGPCKPSHLTANGLKMMIRLGQRLRRRYEKSILGEISSGRDLDVRTSLYSRTFLSALGVISGLLGSGAGVNLGLEKVQIHRSSNFWFCDPEKVEFCGVCESKLGTLHGQTHEARHQFARQSTEPLLQDMRSLLSRFSVKFKNFVPLEIFDSLVTYVCSGHDALPCPKNGPFCADFGHLALLYQWIGKQNAILKDTPLFRQVDTIYGSGVLRQVVQLGEKLAERKNGESRNSLAPKLTLFSGHDITLAPILALLGAFNGEVPYYGSSIIFELYSNEKQQVFIRVLYNEKALEPRHYCSEPLENGLCPLETFSKHVMEDLPRKAQLPPNIGDFCMLV